MIHASSSPRTWFQESGPWRPEIDSQADVAIVYGVDPTFEERVASFRTQGYRVAFMTGAAWGKYQDYVEGRFDGKSHDDEGQVRRDGAPMMHGPKAPYFVPSPPYRQYLKSLLRRAVDAGVESVLVEEPEFWAFCGYSEAFRREWRAVYGTEWAPPHTSVDSRYRAAQLMHRLYVDTLAEILADAIVYTLHG
jgi:hypothetical protein